MHAAVKHSLKTIAAAATLSSAETRDALDAMTAGEATPAQMGAFLMGLRARGETVDEITGAAQYLRSQMLTVELPGDAIDIVGTGGDGHNTFNVSTCAAFVAAGAGVKVAKHGNRSVSSLSGASDVLSALGVRLDRSPDRLGTAVAKAGVAFLWAPMHHPAMKVWAPIRAELGTRTLFNILGPICNPARVTRQVIGVFAKEWVVPIAEVMRNLGSEHVWVVHGHDGLDELTTTAPTTVAELVNGSVRAFEVTPEEAGLARATLAELRGGDAARNAEALQSVLDGATGPYRDIVLLNTAAALIVAGRAATLKDGVTLAANSIDSGAARNALEKLKEITASP